MPTCAGFCFLSFEDICVSLGICDSLQLLLLKPRMTQHNRLAFLPSRPTVTAWVVSGIAILLWLGLQPLRVRFADVPSLLQSMSQLSGILGLVLFSLTLFLSARFRWMERLMGALNRVYIEHHLIGALAFLFLLIHPVIALVYALQIHRPNMAQLIVPGLDLALTCGILSLWLLITLMILTMYLRPRYGLWRKTHQYMGLALFLGGLHGMLITSDVSSSLVLRWYVLGLAAIGFCVYLAYTVLNRVSVKRYAYTVAGLHRIKDNVLTVDLTPTSQPLLSVAGQFIFIRFLLDGRWSETHPFSLTSTATETGLAISFKILGDDTQRFFDLIQEGTRAQIEGPFGTFGQELASTHHAVCVAGGIGVTPFLSLLQTIQSHQSIDVYYAVKNTQEAAHLADLERMAAASVGKIQIRPWYSEAQGFLTGEAIQKACKLEANDHVFVCGPPGLMRAVRSQLVRLGIANLQIHSEEFSLDS